MRIVIGDHWATGPVTQLEDGTIKVLGPSLANYLACYEPTLSVSKAWSHTLEQIELFENIIAQGYGPHPGDEIIWILSDPFHRWEAVTDFEFLLDGRKTIKEGVDHQIDHFLTLINEKAEQAKINPIKIVGGGGDLSTVTLQSELPRLQFPVPSWSKLLDPDFNCTVFNEDSLSKLSGYVIKYRPELMEELGKITDAVKQRRKSILRLQNTRDMTGDIDAMPTSRAHKKLFVTLFPGLKF